MLVGELCIAVDSLGNAVKYNGAEWSRPASVDPSTPVSSIASLSCSSASFCVAVDSSGNALSYNGPSPTRSMNLLLLRCRVHRRASASAVDWSGNWLS